MSTESVEGATLPIAAGSEPCAKSTRCKPRLTRRKPSRPDSLLYLDIQAAMSSSNFEQPQFLVYDCSQHSDVRFRPLTRGDYWRRKREFDKNKARPFIPISTPSVEQEVEATAATMDAEEGNNSNAAVETIFSYVEKPPSPVNCQLTVSTCDHLLSAASPSPSSSQADSGWTSPEACSPSGSEDPDDPTSEPKSACAKSKSVTFVVGDALDRTESESSRDGNGKIRRVRRYPRSFRNAAAKTTKWRSQAATEGKFACCGTEGLCFATKFALRTKYL